MPGSGRPTDSGRRSCRACSTGRTTARRRRRTRAAARRRTARACASRRRSAAISPPDTAWRTDAISFGRGPGSSAKSCASCAYIEGVAANTVGANAAITSNSVRGRARVGKRNVAAPAMSGNEQAEPEAVRRRQLGRRQHAIRRVERQHVARVRLERVARRRVIVRGRARVLAGRARIEDERGRAVLGIVRRRPRLDVAAARREVELPRVRAADRAQVAQGRQLAAHLLDAVGEIARRDHLDGTAVVEQRAQLERTQEHVERHRHRADAHGAEEDRGQLRRVVHEERDAIARRHPELAQRAGGTHHLVGELGVAPHPLRLADRRLLPPPRFYAVVDEGA